MNPDFSDCSEGPPSKRQKIHKIQSSDSVYIDLTEIGSNKCNPIILTDSPLIRTRKSPPIIDLTNHRSEHSKPPIIDLTNKNKNVILTDILFDKRLEKLCMGLISAFKQTLERSNGNGDAYVTPSILVVTPRRHSCVRIYEKLTDILSKPDIICLCTGGRLRGSNDRWRVKIQVATPGRLLSQITMGKISLERVDVLVLEDSSELMNGKELRSQMIDISSQLPDNKKIKVIFSDPIDYNDDTPVQERNKRLMINASNNVESIGFDRKIEKDRNHFYYTSNSSSNEVKIVKKLLLYYTNTRTKIIIYSGMKCELKRIFDLLKHEIEIKYILHGDHGVTEREVILKYWNGSNESGSPSVLFSTDLIAASCSAWADVIINYSFPKVFGNIDLYLRRCSTAKDDADIYCIMTPDKRREVSIAKKIITQLKNAHMITFMECNRFIDGYNNKRKRKYNPQCL